MLRPWTPDAITDRTAEKIAVFFNIDITVSYPLIKVYITVVKN